jgi:hypothetical protein
LQLLDPWAVVLMHHRWETAVPGRERLGGLSPEIAANLPPRTDVGGEEESVTFGLAASSDSH